MSTAVEEHKSPLSPPPPGDDGPPSPPPAGEKSLFSPPPPGDDSPHILPPAGEDSPSSPPPPEDDDDLSLTLSSATFAALAEFYKEQEEREQVSRVLFSCAVTGTFGISGRLQA